MYIKKIIERYIDVESMNDIYVADYNAMYLKLLKQKFLHRCIEEVFVLDILRILKRGNLTCTAKSIEGGTYINIRFEVYALVYNAGEVLFDCKIIQIANNNNIIAKAEYCSVKIENVSTFDIFKEDDILPVIIKTARYPLSDTEIAISAIPLIPIPRNIIYYKVSNIKPFEYKDDEIKAIHTDIKKFDAKAVKFFVELLFPYKIAPKLDGKKYSLTELNKIKNGDIVYIPDRKLLDDEFVVIDKEKEVVMEIEFQDLAEILISEHKRELLTLLGFLSRYNLEKAEQNAILWKIYKKLKL